MTDRTLQGRISVHPRGFGFFETEQAGEPLTAFVTPPDLNPFLDGDVVDATVTEGEPGRFSATKLSLVSRGRKELFGTVAVHRKQPFLRVDKLVSNTDWPFEEGAAAGLREGTAVVAEIRGARVAPLRVLGAGADLGLERVIVRYGIRGEFEPACVEAARAAVRKVVVGQRRDLRDLPTVTIDAASTVDIDDALSIHPPGADGAIRVLVSIADVDALVPEGSPVDVEARRRGTSVYLAGRVLPMLPDVLSSEAISLLPGQDRYTMTAELRIDPEGEVTSMDVYPSVIRSHARLTYDAVTELFEEGSSDEIPAGVVPTVRWLRTAAARLSAVRAARGGVELLREEAYVTLDAATNEPTSIAPRRDTEAHRVVERLMVAANEAVAGWLFGRGLPAMFRVHDEPDPDRVEVLERFAHNFGIEAGFGGRLRPRGLSAFDAQVRSSHFAPALRTVLGTVLGPARYTVHPSMHFGLAAPLYLHFTSPIRRYADLVVHRVLKRYLAGERALRAGDPSFEDLAVDLNQLSRVAAKAESERLFMLAARLFGSRVGEVVEGHVVAVKPFGLVVQIAGTGVTGTIALDALPEGPYRVDLLAHSIASAARRFTVGDAVVARVAGTNEDLGRIDLALVEG